MLVFKVACSLFVKDLCSMCPLQYSFVPLKKYFLHTFELFAIGRGHNRFRTGVKQVLEGLNTVSF